jgi:hypothetical protein
MVLYVLHQRLSYCHGVSTRGKRWSSFCINFIAGGLNFLIDSIFLFLFFPKITCHPSFMGDLPTFRAVESNVQVSGELTTSRGPGTAFQFALSFVEQMFGIHAAEDVDRTLVSQMRTFFPIFVVSLLFF